MLKKKMSKVVYENISLYDQNRISPNVKHKTEK